VRTANADGLIIEIWPIFSTTEAFEIVGISFDAAGSAYIVGSVGPYLTRDEAMLDVANVTKDNLRKKDFKFVVK
jgi:hypothetical protein